MGWIVTGYFTKDSYYSKHAQNLIQSLKKFNLPYEISPVEDFNCWFKGMQYKPIFLANMLKKYYPHSIVYVDVDAIFCQYPDLFDTIHKDMPEVNIAIHMLDHSKYRRKDHPSEMLSGTIFLRNTNETSIIIQKWILALSKDSKLWDQRALQTVLQNHSFYNLPEEYCVIFDYMSSVKKPVIKHFQASREVKKSSSEKKKRVRVVENNGIVKLGRTHLPNSLM